MAHRAFGKIDQSIREPSVLRGEVGRCSALVVRDHAVGRKVADVDLAGVGKDVRAGAAALERKRSVAANRSSIAH